MVTGALDINTDPGCRWTSNSDMTLSCSSGQHITMAVVVAETTSIYKALAAAGPSDTNMKPGG